MVSIPHNAQTSSLEESDKLEATKERGGVEEDEGGRRQRLEVAGIPPIRREMIQYENFSLAHKASSDQRAGLVEGPRGSLANPVQGGEEGLDGASLVSKERESV